MEFTCWLLLLFIAAATAAALGLALALWRANNKIGLSIKRCAALDSGRDNGCSHECDDGNQERDEDGGSHFD